jgi:hypothetical protein
MPPKGAVFLSARGMLAPPRNPADFIREKSNQGESQADEGVREGRHAAPFGKTGATQRSG